MDRRKSRHGGSRDGEARAASQLRVVRAGGPAHYRLRGAIDAANAPEFADWIRGVLDGVDLHLHLGTVEFRDTSGITELVEVARQLDGEARLILHELPEGLTTAIRAVGWSDLPSIVIADRREADG